MEKSLNEDTYEKLKYDIMNFKLVPGDSISARLAMARWYNKVEEAGMHLFQIDPRFRKKFGWNADAECLFE